jgi:hypothetical protein
VTVSASPAATGASEGTTPAAGRQGWETTDIPAAPLIGQRRPRPRWPWLIGLFLALGLLGALFTWLPDVNDRTPTPTITPDEEVALVATTPAPEPTAQPTAAPTLTAPPTPTPTEIAATPDTKPITETYQVGQSVLDRPIEAVRLGKGSSQIIFIGGLHAGFAPATVELAQRSIAYFNQNLDEIPDSVALYIIPSANPDSNLALGELPGRVNGNNVDLNRNWDCRWQQDAGWRGGEIVAGLGGQAPFSEPETRSLAEFILEQEAMAVVFWEARASGGLVSPGRCEEPSISQPLADTYGLAAGYQIADFEELVNQVVNGDGTNWLDEQGIPAIAVLLPNYDDVDWENNLAGMLAVLQEFGGEAVPDIRDNR